MYWCENWIFKVLIEKKLCAFLKKKKKRTIIAKSSNYLWVIITTQGKNNNSDILIIIRVWLSCVQNHLATSHLCIFNIILSESVSKANVKVNIQKRLYIKPQISENYVLVTIVSFLCWNRCCKPPIFNFTSFYRNL